MYEIRIMASLVKERLNGYFLPSTYEDLTQCCFNIGPLPMALVQHWNNLGSSPRVCWVLSARIHVLPLECNGCSACICILVRHRELNGHGKRLTGYHAHKTLREENTAGRPPSACLGHRTNHANRTRFSVTGHFPQTLLCNVGWRSRRGFILS